MMQGLQRAANLANTLLDPDEVSATVMLSP